MIEKQLILNEEEALALLQTFHESDYSDYGGDSHYDENAEVWPLEQKIMDLFPEVAKGFTDERKFWHLWGDIENLEELGKLHREAQTLLHKTLAKRGFSATERTSYQEYTNALAATQARKWELFVENYPELEYVLEKFFGVRE